MRLIAILVSTLFILAALMTFTSTDVSAGDTYYITYYPSSNNASYWTVYPKFASSHADTTAPCTHADLDLLDLYSSTTATKYVTTNDFTNTTWNVTGWTGGLIPYYYVIGWMPNESATLLSVNIIAIFYSSVPQLQLSYSLDNESTYTTSSVFAASGGGIAPYYSQAWNVTSLSDWGVADLNSTDIFVKLKATPVVGTHYYLEYLGFYLTWTSDEFSETAPPTEDPGGETPDELDYGIIYTAEGIIGIMGLVGLIGMVATPAIMVYANRQNQGDGKMNLFIKGLVMFMFFLTFFMVSLGI